MHCLSWRGLDRGSVTTVHTATTETFRRLTSITRRCPSSCVKRGAGVALSPTVSLAGLSIWFMTGWWITLVCGLVAMVLATLNVTLHWSSDSGAAALTGGSGVLLAFVVLGTLIEDFMRNAAWVREDLGQLWFGVFTAFVCFTLGVLKAAPWVVSGVLAERHRADKWRP